jgi:hypothetical protein
MAEINYHVEPHASGSWSLRREGRDKPDAWFQNREAAVSAARVLAHRMERQVVIHDLDGSSETTDWRGEPVV